MILYSLVVIAGIAGLWWSADRFVDSASLTAQRLGISPLLVGMTIVSLGTSAPEAMVSLSATLNEAPDMVLGNVLGSNIANIALVLGITALIAPIPVRLSMVRKELPLMVGGTALAGYALHNGILSLYDALAMLAMLTFCVLWLFLSDDAPDDNFPEANQQSLPSALFCLLLTLTTLAMSARLLVWSATELATALGVSELVVGLTVVAVGTSLPELAASAASALKRQHDIAIGNIIGSNLFNILLVLAIPGLLAPGPISTLAAERDYPILLGVTLAFSLLLIVKRHGAIPRWIGLVFLAVYLGYLLLLAGLG